MPVSDSAVPAHGALLSCPSVSKAVPSAHGGRFLLPSVCQSAVSAHGDHLSSPSVSEATVSAHCGLLSLPSVSDSPSPAHSGRLSLPSVSDSPSPAHSGRLSLSTVSKPASSAHGDLLSHPSVIKSASLAHHSSSQLFHIDRLDWVFLGQAREPLLRLLRAWTGENPLLPGPDNHLDHSFRSQPTINAVILDSQRPVPGLLPGTGTRPSASSRGPACWQEITALSFR